MESTPLILAIETATRAGSICLAEGSNVLGSIVGDAALSHSNSLLIDLDQLLDRTNKTLDQIDLFAAAVGPGSFTGLRIGLATVKALASTLKRPCVGISTLEAIAWAAAKNETGETIVSLLPAGRGEVFVQAFRTSEEGSISALDDPAHLSPARVLERYQNIASITWAGEGIQTLSELLGSYRHPDIGPGDSHQNERHWTIAPTETDLSVSVAALSMDRYTKGQLEDAEALSAVYVRPSDAELKNNVLSN